MCLQTHTRRSRLCLYGKNSACLILRRKKQHTYQILRVVGMVGDHPAFRRRGWNPVPTARHPKRSPVVLLCKTYYPKQPLYHLARDVLELTKRWLHVAALFVRKETGKPIGTIQNIDGFDPSCGRYRSVCKSPMHSPYAWIWNTGGESLGGIWTIHSVVEDR